MRTVVVLLALCFSAGALAQTYKCKDKAGKVTYTGTECHLLGLTSAGEVADRMNTSPAYKAPPQAAKPAAQPSTTWTPPPNPAAKPAPKGEDEADPNRRCFRVKTATGYATRCNEKPEEEPAKK